MVDLETLAQDTDSVIVSVGAVKFSFIHDDIETFYTNVDPRDGKRLGLRITEDTLEWWRKQNPEAVKAWIKNGVSVDEFTTRFTNWLGADSDKIEMWAQGIDFDFPIMKSNYQAVDKPFPWKWWNQSDSRTVFKIAQFNTKTAERVGHYHNALDDCMNQIRWLKNILNNR